MHHSHFEDSLKGGWHRGTSPPSTPVCGRRGGEVNRCPFCLSLGRLSKEHLLSNPMCEALGVDRRTISVAFSENTGRIGKPLGFDDRTIRLPCRDCNSGWMSDLETETAQVLRNWRARLDRPLGDQGCRTLIRWLAKTATVLLFSEAEARRFMRSPTDAALPDITTARKLRSGDPLDHVVAGIALSTQTDLLWAVGNPSVLPRGPNNISCRAVNAAALNLGPLQLWIAMPIVAPDRLNLPTEVRLAHAGLQLRDLELGTPTLSLSNIEAYYSPATTQRFFRALELARQLA